MNQYEYRVVPFIGEVMVGTFSKDSAHKVSKQLQRVIEKEARDGWEFHSIEKVTIEVKRGCFGLALGTASSYTDFDQIIFRKTA